ncbi:MAG: ABC transporter ATP-binding protein, partial [bacterium]
MSLATLANVSYWYPRSETPALANVSLEIEEGSFTLLAGHSAGGKSTLLRVFNGLVPQFHGGRMTGSALVAGYDPARTPARNMAMVAGMVFQEPEAQAVAETVEEEVAFGMEQQGIPRPEMLRRLDQSLGVVSIEHLRHRRLHTLSGGERQRVAVASVLALEPRLLLLDEPTSQLDPSGAEALITALERLRRRGDMTIIAAEHRLERLLPVVDGVIGVSGGVATPMTTAEAAERLDAVPAVCQIARSFDVHPVPLTVESARGVLPPLQAHPRELAQLGDRLLEADGVTVAYGEHVALRDVSLTLREGEIVALVGANGSGKTTLFRALTGLTRPVAGAITYPGTSLAPGAGVREITGFAGLVPQDPAIALYHETIAGELHETLRNRTGKRPRQEDVVAAAETWGIGHLVDRNPRDVSVGQQQRVAIAAMLVHQPKVWLLDEPTRGADGRAKTWLAERLQAHATAGGAAIVATHDIESACQFATRVVGLSEGSIVFDLPAAQAFAATGPYPSQVGRLLPGAVTLNEVA